MARYPSPFDSVLQKQTRQSLLDMNNFYTGGVSVQGGSLLDGKTPLLAKGGSLADNGVISNPPEIEEPKPKTEEESKGNSIEDSNNKNEEKIKKLEEERKRSLKDSIKKEVLKKIKESDSLAELDKIKRTTKDSEVHDAVDEKKKNIEDASKEKRTRTKEDLEKKAKEVEKAFADEKERARNEKWTDAKNKQKEQDEKAFEEKKKEQLVKKTDSSNSSGSSNATDTLGSSSDLPESCPDYPDLYWYTSYQDKDAGRLICTSNLFIFDRVRGIGTKGVDHFGVIDVHIMNDINDPYIYSCEQIKNCQDYAEKGMSSSNDDYNYWSKRESEYKDKIITFENEIRGITEEKEKKIELLKIKLDEIDANVNNANKKYLYGTFGYPNSEEEFLKRRREIEKQIVDLEATFYKRIKNLNTELKLNNELKKISKDKKYIQVIKIKSAKSMFSVCKNTLSKRNSEGRACESGFNDKIK